LFYFNHKFKKNSIKAKQMFNEGCKAPNIQKKKLMHTLTAQHEEESVECELMEVI